MKYLCNIGFSRLILAFPALRYVPDVVWRSKWFWIALVVMIIGILLYHNRPRKGGRWLH